jgi:hypothetical protein
MHPASLHDDGSLIDENSRTIVLTVDGRACRARARIAIVISYSSAVPRKGVAAITFSQRRELIPELIAYTRAPADIAQR